jgi:hypothetical protein
VPAASVLDIKAMVCEVEDGQRLCAELSWPGRLLDRAEVAVIGAAWLDALREFARCGDGPAVRPGPEAARRSADFPLITLADGAQTDGAQASRVVDGAAA